MKKHDEWAAATWWTYNSGIAILDPTAEDYEDEFADGYVKCIAFNGEEQTRPTWHKVNYDHNGEAYFTKYHRRYYLDEMQRCNCW